MIPTKDIEQTILIKASPHEIYEALMDSKKHATFSDSPAKISREVGGKIMAYDGYIDGENIELVPDKKIVQLWRGSEWPKGHFSTVTFLLEEVPEGTRLSFSQVDIPEKEAGHISKGWKTHYWKPIKKMLEK